MSPLATALCGARLTGNTTTWTGGWGGYGVVTHVFGLTEQEPNVGHVRVHWDCDKVAGDLPMRMGAGGFRDLVVMSFPKGTHVQIMDKPGRVAALIRAF